MPYRPNHGSIGTLMAHASIERSSRPAAATAVMIVVAICTPFLAIASPSLMPVALSGLVLIIIIALLWRAQEPPILLLPVLFQWSEVAAYPLATIWKQIPLNSMSTYGADLDTSAAYGFAGVTALALGLRLGLVRRTTVSFESRLRAEARVWRLSQVLRIGLGAIALGYLFSALTGIAGPARELVGSASGVKYVGIFLIVYWCLINGRNYGLVAGLTAFEIIFGMTGFFAEFKNSILTLVVASIAARPRLKATDALIMSSVAAIVLLAATFWTAIKVDYRSMVNQGTGAQVVDVPLEERLTFLANAFGNIDGSKLADGFDRLVERHGYIEFLALVMQNVPAVVPFEDGSLTWSVISHIAMPRILFPNKLPLPSDTVIMAKYTGLQFVWNENTSISIGNLGELYVDFGLIGGLLAEVAIGLMVALIYRLLRDNLRCPAILTAGFCVMTVLPIAYFGTAYIKLIGSFVLTSAIAVLLQKYLAPRIAASYGLPIVCVPQMRR